MDVFAQVDQLVAMFHADDRIATVPAPVVDGGFFFVEMLRVEAVPVAAEVRDLVPRVDVAVLVECLASLSPRYPSNDVEEVGLVAFSAGEVPAVLGLGFDLLGGISSSCLSHDGRGMLYQTVVILVARPLEEEASNIVGDPAGTVCVPAREDILASGDAEFLEVVDASGHSFYGAEDQVENKRMTL